MTVLDVFPLMLVNRAWYKFILKLLWELV